VASDWTCPRCGEDDGIEVNVRVVGWMTYQYGPHCEGGSERVSEDSVTYFEPKTGRCIACGKVIPNPKAGLYRPAKVRRQRSSSEVDRG
jgi:hypothetical protein